GRGAMGVVYRAEDPELERTVAVKTILLSGDAAERASYEARFRQEAKAAGKLSHPGIVTIYDVGREGDLAYMAMELLSGTDLRQRLAQERPSLREAVDLAMQIADALAFAHEHGVVHRDIKPANVMLVRGNRAKLMDFGLARLQINDVKTQTGVLLGTPKYMSPEQVSGGTIDHRSDLFALGTVFYEMLVGRPPFSGTDTAQLLHRIASAAHAAPSRIDGDIPPVIDLIIARALEKDPAARYQSAQDFASDLASALAELPASAAARAAMPEAEHTARLDASADATQKLDGTEAMTTTAYAKAGAQTQATQRIVVADEVSASWPLSRRFDSSTAWWRLVEPTHEDRVLLWRVPHGASRLSRWLSDPDRRLFAGLVLLGLLAGGAIVFL
ncbi:MAG: serine/threonine-protein kinase, partial [Gammaproteobacteria bacterium]